ncbi:MAG: family metalloprotease protein, partial [Acidobacteria bacterium]|nr:family metalloprotease protein [Acidobacteriota bacterium]
LMQADGTADLENSRNPGDPGDPYAQAALFNDSTTPSSRSYSGQPTSIFVQVLSPSGPSMQVDVRVTGERVPIRRPVSH